MRKSARERLFRLLSLILYFLLLMVIVLAHQAMQEAEQPLLTIPMRE